jgi:hypothetical protein
MVTDSLVNKCFLVFAIRDILRSMSVLERLAQAGRFYPGSALLKILSS